MIEEAVYVNAKSKNQRSDRAGGQGEKRRNASEVPFPVSSPDTRTMACVDSAMVLAKASCHRPLPAIHNRVYVNLSVWHSISTSF